LSKLLPALLELRWREPLACAACPFSRPDALLDVVDCDQRFRFPMPSRKLPMPSIAAVAVAALLRRRRGGVVALLWGLDGSGAGSLSESDADRFTVETDDDDIELLREDRRRECCEGAARSAEGGAAAKGV
jgi:hypothetical protein